VLGDCRPADRQMPSQLANRPGPLREQLEERPPGRIGQRRQAISVSRHER
jgi:hypothetical protein